jgi:hypothetical protein
VLKCNLSKANRILRILRLHALCGIPRSITAARPMAVGFRCSSPGRAIPTSNEPMRGCSCRHNAPPRPKSNEVGIADDRCHQVPRASTISGQGERIECSVPRSDFSRHIPPHASTSPVARGKGKGGSASSRLSEIEKPYHSV